jgi:hypothetical protein
MVALVFPLYAAGTPDVRLDQNGVISGIVTAATVPVNLCVVTLHWEKSGECIGRTWTDATGYFEFTGLDPGLDTYFTVYHDLPGGTVYNHKVLAKLTPA